MPCFQRIMQSIKKVERTKQPSNNKLYVTDRSIQAMVEISMLESLDRVAEAEPETRECL